jgi:hypothetical protein
MPCRTAPQNNAKFGSGYHNALRLIKSNLRELMQSLITKDGFNAIKDPRADRQEA